MNRVPIYMSDPLYDKISDKIRASYPNSCILFIDEIINPVLEAQYQEFKATLGSEPNEKLLFHGTHARLIDTIAAEGFDPTKNVTSAYGRGNYFATTAVYSSNYMKSADSKGISYMFLAKVALGKTIQSTTITNATKVIQIADSYTNCESKPTIYVSPHRYAAYPKYIIAFHKNAT